VRGQLDCHLIDLDTLSPFDVMNLRRFISLDSEIMGRRATGLCAKCQRKVAKTIKHSRNLGFLAHIDEFVVKDQRPHMEENFHGSVEGEEAFVSKTVGWRK
jgi:ribosomal protein S18